MNRQEKIKIAKKIGLEFIIASIINTNDDIFYSNDEIDKMAVEFIDKHRRQLEKRLNKLILKL